jgi:outer membrane protein assembly factor BamB
MFSEKIAGIVFIYLIFFIHSIDVTGQGRVTQFRGPDRDGIYPDVGLLDKWPPDGPPLLLKIDGLGQGFSSAVIHNNIIYTSGLKDTVDMVSAFDSKGKLLWQQKIGAGWLRAHSETRNTPTIEGNRLYISSGIGDVVCLDAVTGRIIWKNNPAKEFKAKFSVWGPAECLLLTDKAVIYIVGGTDASVVALNKKDGTLLWKSAPVDDDLKAYYSPLMIERNGKKIILIELARQMLGINSTDGKILWHYDLRPANPDSINWLNHTNIPVYRNGEIFITRGYNMNAIMLSLSSDGNKVSLKWKTPALDTHIGGVVEHQGYIYGSTWVSNSKGNWACLDWKTGKLMYDQEWFNKGAILYADGLLYCMEEKNGNIALVQPGPAGFKVISSFRVTEGAGPYFSHPSIYDRKLLIRHGDALMIYDIRKK